METPYGFPQGRPFTNLVMIYRDFKKLSYGQVATRTKDARSAAWFNKLCTSGDPWAVNPPPKGTWDRLAAAFHVTEDAIREFIAREWFDVKPADAAGAPVPLLPGAETLNARDLQLVRSLVTRLTDPVTDPDPAATADEAIAGLKAAVDSAPDIPSPAPR